MKYKIDYNQKTLSKNVNKDKHFFNSSKAWGIDVITFEEAIASGVNRVIYSDPTHKKEYTAMVQDVINHAWLGDFGHGQQYFLNEKYWKEEDLNAEPVYQVS